MSIPDASARPRAVSAPADSAASAFPDWPRVDLDAETISPDAMNCLPPGFAVTHRAIAFRQVSGVLWLALDDPLATGTIDAAAFLSRATIRPMVASAEQIARAIERGYGPKPHPASTAAAGNFPGEPENLSGELDESSTESDAPIIRCVEAIIADGVRQRASDIHLEPLERRFRVRYRIDGVLHEAADPPWRQRAAIVSRVKIMAHLDIAEKRLPQDGRLQIKIDGRPLDLRVSSLPSGHGESVVLRVLDHGTVRIGLAELGLDSAERSRIEQLVTAADGMVLVTGPTGSGKTTTLYSCLHHLNRPDRKIITVEDPVEYQLAGVNQVPVNSATGVSFASALRAMLRQSPNIVMLGEIRDRETAEIAINASLTGHLVLSTLHTNDAPSAVTRLLDIGAKPFLVAAALRAVVAQRLVRRVCPACRQRVTASVRERELLRPLAGDSSPDRLWRGAGCGSCHGTGFQGRVGIFEIFLVHDGIRAMIYDNVTASRLRQQARRDGMRTMRDDGLRKVLAGLTTIEEVVAATAVDGPEAPFQQHHPA